MNKLKIGILLFLTTLITGCELDDDGANFFYEFVPIQSVDIPDQFIRGEVVKITVFYQRPTDCHSFGGFDYQRDANQRTVAVVNIVVNNRPCNDLETEDPVEASFDFHVGLEESYVFRFWQGNNNQGDTEFLEIEVPVVSGN